MEPLPFDRRLVFAFVAFFRILFDGAFARRAYEVRTPPPKRLPSKKKRPVGRTEAPPKRVVAKKVETEKDDEDEDEEPKKAPPKKLFPKKTDAAKDEPAKKPEPKKDEPKPRTPEDGALQLLAILQREGRFVDFVEQDVEGFPDADIGAAARVVHEGCRKALHGAAKISPIRTEEEDSKVRVDKGFSPAEIKLTGKVEGEAPFSGVLRHRGWRVRDLTLPIPVKGHDAEVVAPAEVEL